MDEMKTLELMEQALKQLTPILTENEYFDDNGWGEGIFKIKVFEAITPPKTRLVHEFIFIYDEDDVFERNADKQLADWVNNIIEEVEA